MNPNSKPFARTSRPVRRSRRTLAVAGIALLSLTAAACGDDDDDGASTTAPAAPAATEAMTETTMADDMTETTEAMTETTMADDMTETTEMMTETTMADDMGGEMMLEPSGPGCAAVPAEGDGSFGGMADDPAATAASNNPVLSTLVGAVAQAGLVDTLNGDGPFTIFAPTNDAFAAVPAADLEAVLADNDLLTSVLTYHVVAGEQLSSAQLIEQGTVATVNGAELTITEGDDGGLVVNGVPAVCMDVPTANATVHIIGGVLLPPA